MVERGDEGEMGEGGGGGEGCKGGGGEGGGKDDDVEGIGDGVFVDDAAETCMEFSFAYYWSQ